MIVRLLLAALAAGLIAGMAMTPAQYVKTIPLIMQAEAYENGGAGHHHGDAAASDEAAHDHGADQSMFGFGRLGDTIVANLVAGAGFALMLAAVALLLGVEFPTGTAGVTRGLLFGAAAWFCVQLAPAMSLPPAVPGFPYADLGDRQAWWMITVAASAVGLWCIAMRPEWAVKAWTCDHRRAASLGVAGSGRSEQQCTGLHRLGLCRGFACDNAVLLAAAWRPARSLPFACGRGADGMTAGLRAGHAGAGRRPVGQVRLRRTNAGGGGELAALSGHRSGLGR
jgi:cobalt transporter subunit CbtA